MFDLERLTKIISDIHRYLDDLERIEIKDPRDLDDIRNFYAVSMILFTLINRVIDLGDEIVTSRNLGVPDIPGDLQSSGAGLGVIDKELASDLSNLVYQRNILAHEYHNLTEEDVFRTYRRVPVIRKFVERAKEHIKDV
uniref:DUF86 domain-containing protein n=1 Tax=Candidatus Methanogaster sp. ANME-2c ERB4 TaxID=2759911 RepID=A0A7G9YKH5_9EURY|nr:hypothetical protein IMNOINEI_00009 [Methanosarcinales archaeon ANME-2c ERB4]